MGLLQDAQEAQDFVMDAAVSPVAGVASLATDAGEALAGKDSTTTTDQIVVDDTSNVDAVSDQIVQTATGDADRVDPDTGVSQVASGVQDAVTLDTRTRTEPGIVPDLNLPDVQVPSPDIQIPQIDVPGLDDIGTGVVLLAVSAAVVSIGIAIAKTADVFGG